MIRTIIKSPQYCQKRGLAQEAVAAGGVGIIGKVRNEIVMKILLAGPGTGKTTKIKTLIKEQYANAENILVLSFTNATVNDLTESFVDYPNVRCFTLHSYALIINHLNDYHILDDTYETPILSRFAENYNIEFSKICYFFHCITFDGMIKECSAFLKSNPVYGEEKVGALDLLIVDEFQDFNLPERELIFQLSIYAKETLILGDDDQSIYGFKDADPVGIIELFNSPDVEKIPHENKCYRCPDVVVDHSKKLISKNVNRIDKSWEKTNKAGNVFFTQKMSQEEANQIIFDVIAKVKKDEPKSSILVLSPVRYYVENLVALLEAGGISFVDFWTSKISIEDIVKIWWSRAIFANKKILNLTFIANTSCTDHFKKKFNEIIRDALQKNFNEATILEMVVDIFPVSFNSYILNTPSLPEFLGLHQEYAIFSDYLDSENLEESLRSLFRKFNPITEFSRDAVNVMSIHKSKGLQADYVFITGLVDGVLPNKIKGLDTIEAQRRLLFVGMTRSMKYLYLISQIEWEGKYVHRMDKSQFEYNYRKKKYYGRASNFISEMK